MCKASGLACSTRHQYLNLLEFFFDSAPLCSQVEFVLDAQPKTGGIAEVLAQSEGRIGRDAALALDDCRDACQRHAGVCSQAICGQTERNKKLFFEDFTWRDIRDGLHGGVLVSDSL